MILYLCHLRTFVLILLLLSQKTTMLLHHIQKSHGRATQKSLALKFFANLLETMQIHSHSNLSKLRKCMKSSKKPWRSITLNETYENPWEYSKPMKIYKTHAAHPFEKRVNSNRTTRKVHGVRGRQNECWTSFANIFDIENLCKSIRNHAYSLKSRKAMKHIWKAMKIHEDL